MSSEIRGHGSCQVGPVDHAYGIRISSKPDGRTLEILKMGNCFSVWL